MCARSSVIKDWSNSKITAQTKALIDITNEFQFKQFINEPTRITESTSSTIDLAFSNRPEIIIPEPAARSAVRGY